MLTSEQRLSAESCRTMLTQGYVYKGDAWGHGLAARIAWVVGQVVADIHGAPAAMKMLDAVSDGINRQALSSPVLEMEARPPAPMPPGMMMVVMPECDADVDKLVQFFGALKGAWGAE